MSHKLQLRPGILQCYPQFSLASAKSEGINRLGTVQFNPSINSLRLKLNVPRL